MPTLTDAKRHVIDKDLLGTALSLYGSEIDDFYLDELTPRPNGDLPVLADVTRTETDATGKRLPKQVCLLMLGEDGVVATPLPEFPENHPMGALIISGPADFTVLAGGMRSAQTFTYDGDAGAFGRVLPVTNPIPSTQTSIGVEVWFHPGLGQRPVWDGDFAAMALTAPQYTRMAFLDRSVPGQLTWRLTPEHPAKPGLLSRLLGQGDVAPVLTPDTMHTLDRSGLPVRDDPSEQVRLDDLMLWREKPHIYTLGTRWSRKYGDDLSAVYRTDGMGVIDGPVWEDVHARHRDGKYRGTNGQFHPSGHFVFRWAYKASDPYGGREQVIDLDTGAQEDVVAPRGLTKAQTVASGPRVWWLRTTAKEGGVVLARCQVA